MALSCEISKEVLTPNDFYRDSMEILKRGGLPFLIGGAFALRCYTGITRTTKDLDIFIRPGDCDAALRLFAEAGYPVEITDSIWLAKVFWADSFVDLIFRSGNGIAEVDDLWFAHARFADVLGTPTMVCPIEETIWSKAFTMERERYDGADVLHLIRAGGRSMDWGRLLARFERHWRVLYSYLVLFGYVYPREASIIPRPLMRDMACRVQHEANEGDPGDRVCQGTLLSRQQYKVDVDAWGYRDPRRAYLGGKLAKEPR